MISNRLSSFSRVDSLQLKLSLYSASPGLSTPYSTVVQQFRAPSSPMPTSINVITPLRNNHLLHSLYKPSTDNGSYLLSGFRPGQPPHYNFPALPTLTIFYLFGNMHGGQNLELWSTLIVLHITVIPFGSAKMVWRTTLPSPVLPSAPPYLPSSPTPSFLQYSPRPFIIVYHATTSN